MRFRFGMIASAALVAAMSVSAAEAREQIRIVGSSTVYPFSTAVAEQFGKKHATGPERYRVPVVESTGTGGGFKIFCEGFGLQYPDFTNASRAIKKSEFEACQRNGVTSITEVMIGYDGLTIAHSKRAPVVQMTLGEVYLALAKEVPGPDGVLVANPHRRWSEINPRLPNTKIEVLGPPPTSGTRDSFHELAMHAGCAQVAAGSPALQALKRENARRYDAVCMTVRTDGAYVEAGENDNVIVQKLGTNPNAFGIFGYSFLAENDDKLRGVAIEKPAGPSVMPSLETIAGGTYPLSRPIFFYAKNQHVDLVPGMKRFVEEFVSDRSMGPDGYLARHGLVPLPQEKLRSVRANALSLKALTADEVH